MGEELDDTSLTIKEVLCEVPGDLRVGGLLLEVSVDSADAITLDVALAEQGEPDCVVLGNPVTDLCLWPRLLSTELVAGVANDCKATCAKLLMHFFVLAVVAVSETSLGGHVDNDDGSGVLTHLAKRDFLLFSDLADRDVQDCG